MSLGLEYDAKQLSVVIENLNRYGEVIAPLVQGGISKSIFDYRNKQWPSHAQSRLKTSNRRPAIGSKWFFRVDVPESDQSVKRVQDANGRMHSTSKAGVLLEEGGIVRPKTGKYLAIPTDSKLVRTPTGKLKSRFKGGPGEHSYAFRGKNRSGGIPKSWKTFVTKSKRGTLTIYRKTGTAVNRRKKRGRPRGSKTGAKPRTGKIEALFWLVPMTFHKPKLRFEGSVRAYQDTVEKNIKKKIESGLRKSGFVPAGRPRRGRQST